MAVAATNEVTPGSANYDPCWGNNWLPAILEAIGGYDAKVYGIRLHFEYASFATATIQHTCGNENTIVLPLYGTNVVSAALGAPNGLQAITVDISENEFVICHCRYAPIDTPLEAIVDALKVKEN